MIGSNSVHGSQPGARFASAVPSVVEGTERAHEPRERIKMSYYVYILRTSANTLYIGQTNNPEKRLKEHQSHKSKKEVE